MAPVLGMEVEKLHAIDVPTLVIPGNDKTHDSQGGIATAKLIKNAILYQLPIQDEDVDVLPFSAWAPHEEAMAQTIANFMTQAQT